MLRTLAATAFLSQASALASAASSPTADAQWGHYFSLWANDATASPQAVERFYASRVNYYGREMTNADVYRDKLYLMRLWPIRAYNVAPGTVVTSCSEDNSRCQVTLVLNFLSENPARGIGVQGETTVSLALVRENGEMKIERENGVPLVRSSCRLTGPNWRVSSNWRCSAFHFPPLPIS